MASRAAIQGPSLEVQLAPGPQELRPLHRASRSHRPICLGAAPGPSRCAPDRSGLCRHRLSTEPRDRRRRPESVRVRLGAHAECPNTRRAHGGRDSRPTPPISGRARQARASSLRAHASRDRSYAGGVRVGLLRLSRGLQRLPRQRHGTRSRASRAVHLRAPAADRARRGRWARNRDAA